MSISQAALIISEEEYNNLFNRVKQDFSPKAFEFKKSLDSISETEEEFVRLLCEAEIYSRIFEDKKYFALYWDNILWLPSRFPGDVEGLLTEKIINYVQKLEAKDEKDFAFVRVGEDYEDWDEDGNHMLMHEFDLAIRWEINKPYKNKVLKNKFKAVYDKLRSVET